jgi:hypothetical protein
VKNFETKDISVTMTQPVSWLEQEPLELKVLTNLLRCFHLMQRIHQNVWHIIRASYEALGLNILFEDIRNP